jgi:hypothetical protein
MRELKVKGHIFSSPTANGMYYMPFANENATLNIEANSHPPKDFLSIVDSPRVDLRATKRIS